MLLVCLNEMSNKRHLKLTAFTNKVRKAADYSFDGFNVFKTLFDGNCMFAALAHQLNMDTQPDTDSTVTAQEVGLRQSLVAYLRDNPSGDTPLVTHCKHPSKEGYRLPSVIQPGPPSGSHPLM